MTLTLPDLDALEAKAFLARKVRGIELRRLTATRVAVLGCCR